MQGHSHLSPSHSHTPITERLTHNMLRYTVSASFSPSFDFPCGLFTLPAAAPVVPAIAHEGLADAPNSAAPLRRFEDVVTFVAQLGHRCDLALKRAWC